MGTFIHLLIQTCSPATCFSQIDSIHNLLLRSSWETLHEVFNSVFTDEHQRAHQLCSDMHIYVGIWVYAFIFQKEAHHFCKILEGVLHYLKKVKPPWYWKWLMRLSLKILKKLRIWCPRGDWWKASGKVFLPLTPETIKKSGFCCFVLFLTVKGWKVLSPPLQCATGNMCVLTIRFPYERY